MIKYGIWLALMLPGAVALRAQLPPSASQQPAQQAPQASQALQASAQTPVIKAPTSIAGIKDQLENSPNPILYTKQILKKRFKIDTITVSRTRSFNSLADSLAYNGKEKKVYGPFTARDGSRFLVQVLSKAPNLFYHIGQIFIDTSIFRYRIADSMSNLILARLKDGSSTFEQLAQTYSMGGEGPYKGDLGWIARGVLQPQMEHEVSHRKKGEVFKIWSPNGVHVIRIADNPKNDTGFALMMRVFL
jgi:hypothetical protein